MVVAWGGKGGGRRQSWIWGPQSPLFPLLPQGRSRFHRAHGDRVFRASVLAGSRAEGFGCYHIPSFAHPPHEVGVPCFLDEETQALRGSATCPRGPQESSQARGFRSRRFQNPRSSPSLDFLRPQFLHLQSGHNTSLETGWRPVT